MADLSFRYRLSRRVVIVGAVVNLFLAIIKLLGGWLGRSHALFADGLHSLSDLVCDALVWVAAKFAHDEADHDHPYGHERIETIVTFLLGALLVFVGVGIGYEAIVRLIDNQLNTPDVYTVWIAGISIIANELVFRYSLHIGKILDSNLLKANAYHSRADSLSSIIVLVALLGSLAGWRFLDPIAAIIVGAFIIKMGVKWGIHAVDELTDRGSDEEELKELRSAILNTDGVEDMHMLRTRRMGGNIFMDVHVRIKPMTSASEGHYIAQQVQAQLMQAYSFVRDVIVHIDIEDHPEGFPENLPASRRELLAILLPRWHTIVSAESIKNIYIHYYEGKIQIEVMLLPDVLTSVPLAALGEKFAATAHDMPSVESLSVGVWAL